MVARGNWSQFESADRVFDGSMIGRSAGVILARGPGCVRELLDGMVSWMEEKEYESIAQMCGSMNIARSPNPREYARGNYMRILQTRQS